MMGLYPKTSVRYNADYFTIRNQDHLYIESTFLQLFLPVFCTNIVARYVLYLRILLTPDLYKDSLAPSESSMLV